MFSRGGQRSPKHSSNSKFCVSEKRFLNLQYRHSVNESPVNVFAFYCVAVLLLRCFAFFLSWTTESCTFVRLFFPSGFTIMHVRVRVNLLLDVVLKQIT